MNDYEIRTADGGYVRLSEFSADEAFFSISFAGCRASTTLTIAECKALSVALSIAAGEMEMAMGVTA